MRLFLLLVLLVALGAGTVVFLYIGTAESPPLGAPEQGVTIGSGGGADLPDAEPVPRDASGTVIRSDPADDLAGYEISANDSPLLPTEVGEREIHLVDLYGQHDVEQLRNERDILEARFRSDLEVAFDSELARGNFETVKPGDIPQNPPRLALDGSPLLSSTSTATDPTTMEIEAHIVTLEQDDYPSLYELRDTIQWLGERIGD